MKKLLLSLSAAMLLATAVSAQSPNAVNYQAAIRNASGAPLASATVPVRFTVRDLTASGTVVFQETNSATTNAQGILNLTIGTGTAVTGTFTGINWSTGAKFLEVEVDAGSGLVSIGNQKMMSVPYAQFAKGVQATSDGGSGLQGATSSSLWWGFYEAGSYRGYLGSYSGKNEDVDFGTGGGNTTGSVHLVVAASPKLTVDSIGNVGVGTRFPKYRFQVDGITGTFNDNGIRIQNVTASKGWSFYASSTGDMIIGNTGNLGTFNGTTGAYTAISDERLKTNIRPLESVLNRVVSLGTKRYQFINNNPEHTETIGVIAQELQKSFPEYVYENKTNEGNPSVQNQLGVDYAGLSVIAIKAIQEQQILIEKLEKRIAELEKK